MKALQKKQKYLTPGTILMIMLLLILKWLIWEDKSYYKYSYEQTGHCYYCPLRACRSSEDSFHVFKTILDICFSSQTSEFPNSTSFFSREWSSLNLAR